MEQLSSIYESYALPLWLVSFLLVILLGVWLLLLRRQVHGLRQRYGALLTGAQGRDLGELLSMYVEQMRLAASKAGQFSTTAEEMDRRLQGSIQRLGLVRFDAFEESGGEQSFALALLDADGDGVVVSSLQGRAESRVYAKPVVNWDSTYNLSAEEKGAIAQAYQREVDKNSHL